MRFCRIIVIIIFFLPKFMLLMNRGGSFATDHQIKIKKDVSFPSSPL